MLFQTTLNTTSDKHIYANIYTFLDLFFFFTGPRHFLLGIFSICTISRLLETHLLRWKTVLCNRRSGFYQHYLFCSTWFPLQNSFCCLIVFVRHGAGEGGHSLTVTDVKTDVWMGDEELYDDTVLVADGSMDRGSTLCILAKKWTGRTKGLDKNTYETHLLVSHLQYSQSTKNKLHLGGDTEF